MFKRFMPQTLFGRSLMIIVTPALLLQFLVGVFFFDRHWGAMTERLSQAVAGEIVHALDRFDPAVGDVSILSSYAENLGLVFSYDVGRDLVDTNRSDQKILSEINTLNFILKSKIQENFVIDLNRDEKWYRVSIQLEGGVLQVEFPERRLYSSTSYIFLLWLIGGSFILFTIAILFMRNQIRPIKRLAMVADRFGRGIDVPRFKPQGAREVRQAAKAFLDMRARIKRQMAQRTEMLSGVSHDLRTPVTRMKLQLEMMEDSEDTRDLLNDVSEMQEMINGYLAFVKDDHEDEERYNAVDMGVFVQGLVETLKRQSLEIDITAVEKNHILRVRQNALKRAISNILTNACKYGDKAWLSLYRIENKLEITIDDDGPGIPEAHYKDVFKPFFRMDESRNLDTGGVGLGLAIVQDIVHSHGGTVTLGESNHGGLRVMVSLPFKE